VTNVDKVTRMAVRNLLFIVTFPFVHLYCNGVRGHSSPACISKTRCRQDAWRNAGRNLDVSLEVTNVFDKYYFLTLFDQTIGGQGHVTGQPGRPREWAVSVKKKF
jgi:iron complex outermembrane receptor protein